MSRQRPDTNADWPFLDEMPPERVTEIRSVIENLPFLALFGVRLKNVDRDRVVLSVACGPKLTQPAGVIHGGVHATLIDTAVAHAIRTTLKEGYLFSTVQLDTKFFKPTSEGELVAEARIVRKGKSLVHADADVRNGAGELVAKGWCIYALRKISGARSDDVGPRDDVGPGTPTEEP